MLKITILLAIFAIVSLVVFKCIVETMSRHEWISMEINGYVPTKCVIAFWVTVLLSVATLVCLIITIIKW